jgi:glycosyltransferase involved in cell wall biosynthesis
MKMLEVIPFFSPIFGGSFISTCNLSKEFAKRGHDVTILTTDFKFDEQFARSIEKEHINVVSVHCIANIGLFLISPSIGNWLNYHIREFDVIHIHNFRSYQNNFIHKYAMQYGIPYILQAHGSVMPFFEKIYLKKCYDLLWGYSILRDVSEVIASTKEEAKQLRKMGVIEDKITLVPNGINLSEYENLPEKGSFRKKYKIEKAEKLILYLGRLHKIKGIGLLIDSFSDLENKHSDIKLAIVGPDDGNLATLKKQIKYLGIDRKILLMGPLYGYDKISAYVDCDVYVLPSFYESFGNTVLEACACGAPVIVTDRCGTADIIDNRAGLVVPYDKDYLRDAILHMLSDEKLRQDFSKNGKLLVRERFNWEKIAEQIECLYFNCIRERLRTRNERPQA